MTKRAGPPRVKPRPKPRPKGDEVEQAARLEGELDSLIKLNGFLDSTIKNIEWLLRQSTEEKRKLQEVIKSKKEEFRKAFGYMPKYQTDEAQPNDVNPEEEPSGK